MILAVLSFSYSITRLLRPMLESNSSLKVCRWSAFVIYAKFDEILAMSLLRLIKMLAWESKMKDRMQQKRDAELKEITKLRFLRLSSSVLRFVGNS